MKEMVWIVSIGEGDSVGVGSIGEGDCVNSEYW